MAAVLGVDACPAGWVGIRLEEGQVTAFCAPVIDVLVERAGPVAVVGIDIPIGLPVAGGRTADVLARAAVGPRRSSVFPTPPRQVLTAPTHAEATARCRELCGFGVSQQAYRLGPRVLEVDAWTAQVLVAGAPRVVEVFPELSFATMAGGHLADPKTTWAGIEVRRQLLRGAGLELAGDLGLTGQRIGVDDVLDAAAVAWSARRVASGEARCLPDPPELVADGRLAAVWV